MTNPLFPLPAPEPSILRQHLDGPAYSPVHQGDPETSAAAARKAAEHAPIVRERVLMLLAESGTYGATDYEVARDLDILRTTAGKRRGELRDEGWVEATDKRRLTDGGTTAVVWALTDEGRAAARVLQANKEKGG